MVEMWWRRFVLSVSLLVLCAAASSREGDSWWLVSPELLEHAKLEMLWQKELPIGKNESLERLFIPFDCAQGRLGNRIYALSDRNFMVSLDRDDGDVIFSRAVAPAGFTVVGLGLYKNEVISIIGGRLVEINPEFGTELGDKRLGFGVTCPAARNSWCFYLAGVDRRLRAFRAEDKVKLFEVAAENESVITSIIADDDFVVFATDAGNCISITPDRPRRLWQFDAAGGIVGPIVRDARWLFFASEDTNVYRINVITGELVWKYQAAALLDKAPRVTREIVYQYVRDKGLTAIDKRSGKFIWQVPGGVELLAEADGKAYVITKIGTLVVMDNRKAKRLYSVNFAGVSKYVANVADSKIYIADEGGRIACLKPVE